MRASRLVPSVRESHQGAPDILVPLVALPRVRCTSYGRVDRPAGRRRSEVEQLA